ncbi:UDP-glycosyltransferase 92A1 [Prunus avium]|uniref:Glycosyltransferase n=1 Tax=Prunus avium TaxID=42229 RepID=A0A6P5TVP9_PRUAV|nr:UDP-glycosyltransferase 92A1 [Prunus avium]
MAQNKEHIVMFPFMAQGHIIPFLALAQLLEQKKGCTITLINTPLNIKKLRSSFPPSSSIRLLEIPFKSSDHGLPPDAENTNALNPHLIFKLFQASLSLKPSFKHLMHNLVHERNGQHGRPACIITDIFFGWTTEIAHELGMRHAVFSIVGGFGTACYYSSCLHLPLLKAKSDETEFTLPDFPEANKFHSSQLSESLRASNGTDPFALYMKKVLTECMKTNGFIINTVEELDRIGTMYLRKTFNLPVWAVGPLLLSSENGTNRAGKEAQLTPKACKNWLDAKTPNSVLYISFGSQNTISKSQMMQLAMALEASSKNFIWVVRPPLEYDINSEFKADEWLPEGFMQRIKTQNKGLIVEQWAPQVEILSHKATSAFLSQCGWNSVMESLIHGVPLLGWPVATEQFFTAKYLVEQLGVCVEVARGRSCEVRHEDIVAKMELVMNETEKGNQMRRKACEAKEIFKDAMKDEDGYKGSSIKALEDFLTA